jgi:pimeloyl-ACP methyl ester carboxylesterase
MSRFITNGIAGDIFDCGSDRTALFCNGLPGAIGPLPAVLAAENSGWNVLFVQYPGTYDSDGAFTVSETVEALATILVASTNGELRDPSDGSLLDPIPAVSLGIGHSFGGLVLTELVRARPSCAIERLLLLAPVYSYGKEVDYGIREDLMRHLEYVRASRPRTYRVGDRESWLPVASGKHVTEKTRAWTGSALAVVGDEDDTFDVAIFQAAFAAGFLEITGCKDATARVISGAGHAMNELIDSGVLKYLE